MAQEIVGVKIQVEGNASESVGSLKKQLREAQADVQKLSDKFGATSEQAIAAAKRAGELKDRIGDAKALTDAFNPDRKFQAFASALQGVVGGFSAVQGALGLIGVESDQVQKTLLKVQSAMALSQGLNSVLEARDSFKNLGAVIQSTTIFQKANNLATIAATAIQKAFGVATVGVGRAFTILKGAIAATGIGLLVVGLTSLIGKISSWIGSTDSAKQANDRLNEAIDQQNKLFEKNRKALQNARQDAITEAKIKGASAEEIFKINQLYGSKDIELTKQNAADKLKTLQEFENKNLEVYYENGQKRVRGDEAQVEQYKKLSKELEDANNIKNDAIRQSDVDAQNERLRIADEGRAKAKQNSAEAKQLAEKQKQERDKELEEEKQRLKEREEANKQADEQIRKAKQENYLASIKDEDERAKKKLQLDLENRNLEIEALNIDNSKKRELKFQAAIDTQNQLDALDIEIKKKQEEKDRELVAQQKEALDKSVEDAKKAAEAKMKIAEQEAQFRKQQLTEVGDALGKLGDIVGKETAAGKALAIAQALINTYQGATEALKQKSTLPSPFDFAAKAINVAAIIASGIKAVKSITAVKVPGGGSGQSAPTTSITSGTGAAPISPALPVQATLTQLNQGSINQLGSATNRAYVVETDITNSQERIKRINRAARLN